MSNADQRFATTQWTVVWQAASDDSNYARPALESFVQSYWQPLYHFARQRGLSQADAEDATQEFLSRTLDGALLANADPVKGRFRTYLLTAWKRFLIDQFRKESRQKQGGQLKQWSLDVAATETSWQTCTARSVDPELAFTVAWANTLLAQVKQQLSNDYSQRGRQNLFEAIWPWLTQTIQAEDYQALASKLTLSASAVKVALHRLRQRYAETLRTLVAQTVDDPREIDREISELIQALKHTGP